MPIQTKETGGNPNAKGWTRRDLVTFLHHRGYTMKLLEHLTGRGATQLSALFARHAANASLAEVNGGGPSGSDQGKIIPPLVKMWIVESVKEFIEHENQVRLGIRVGAFNPLPMPEDVRNYFYPAEKRNKIAREKEAARAEASVDDACLVIPYPDGRQKENIETRRWMVEKGFTISFLADEVFHVSRQAVQQRLTRVNGLRLNILLKALKDAGIEY